VTNFGSFFLSPSNLPSESDPTSLTQPLYIFQSDDGFQLFRAHSNFRTNLQTMNLDKSKSTSPPLSPLQRGKACLNCRYVFASISETPRPLTHYQKTENGSHKFFATKLALTVIRDATAKNPAAAHAHGGTMNANTLIVQARPRRRSSRNISPSSKTAFATWKIPLNRLHPCSWQIRMLRNRNRKPPTIQVTNPGLSESRNVD